MSITGTNIHDPSTAVGFEDRVAKGTSYRAMFLVSELSNVTAAFEIPCTQQRQPHSSVDLLKTPTESVEADERCANPLYI